MSRQCFVMKITLATLGGRLLPGDSRRYPESRQAESTYWRAIKFSSWRAMIVVSLEVINGHDVSKDH